MRIKILLLSLLLSSTLYGQEMWGISNSNFSGNMGIFLNPTTIVGAPYQYEINFIAANAFAENANVYAFKNEKSFFHGLTGTIFPGKDTPQTLERDPSTDNIFAH